MSPTIPEQLTELKNLFEREAENIFPEALPEAPALGEAMAYSYHAGGKRIRPILAIAAAKALGREPEAVVPAALAIEMIHTYSLIHDDLPAMDNDDFRRGKPTSHKKFGEALAILAGDGLLTEAFHIAATKLPGNIPPAGKLRFIKKLSFAAGIRGMVAGQVLDMEHPVEPGPAFLRDLHLRKTGAMIQISCITPALLWNTPENLYTALGNYGDKIGLLFQVVDDILDETATLAQLGKTPGKDREQHKLTYPAIYGIEGTEKLADSLLSQALAAVSEIPDPALLTGIARFIRERSH
ncbi:MAG: polyprenyl synthetase family protein [Acidobacteria bacterium]|nr:MAG: polyprenyl synthetase family protein [Acidobacteriota bacterium]RLE24154.1 MAG: polyprenyl synthetase family protein [Acidobacteriota bacterium]